MSDEPGRERAFIAYRVNNRTCADVARELGTSAPSVIRWARAFEKQYPERARQMLAAAPPLGVPGGSEFLARIGREQRASAVPVRMPDDEPPELDADDFEVEADAYDAMSLLKRAIKANLELARSAEAERNMTLVSRCNRDLLGLVNHMKGLEKMQRSDENVLHVARSDIDAAYASVLEKMRVVCDKPLLCSECGRKLSVRLAGAEE